MAEIGKMVGGLAAVNTGEITDSYVIWNRAYHRDSGMLVAKNDGTVQTSVFVHKGECEGLYDKFGVLHREQVIRKTTDLKNAGFDTSRCWKYVGGNALLEFDPDYWHSVSKDYEKSPLLHLKTVEQYIAFADKVNDGDVKYLNAKVFLDCDLNFHGRSIPVIGKKRECAFAGVFDGQDHIIWNGVVRDSGAIYAGVFGYLKGTVLNLIFDGRVVGGNKLAGLCGYNLGRIDCCGAVVRIYAKDERCHIGGLVAQNEGSVARSYVLFEPKHTILPIIPITAVAGLCVLVGFMGYSTIAAAMELEKDYATIEVDPMQEKISGSENIDAGTDVEKNGAHSMAFTFSQVVTISRSAGTCKLDFINPASDSNKIVIELQAVNAEGERVTIAKSKAILPGYQIENLTLSESAYGVLTGAETEGYVILVPYDTETENKAVVQTTLPVKLVFEG